MDTILIGKGEQQIHLLPKYANRHGLVAGATQLGPQILRGVLGGILGGGRRR